MKKVKGDTHLFKFLSVLEESVWGCILGAYFVTSVLLWVFDRSQYRASNEASVKFSLSRRMLLLGLEKTLTRAFTFT